MTHVVIFNINTEIKDIIKYFKSVTDQVNSLLFVTSHALFQNEINLLRIGIKIPIEFKNFGDYNLTEKLLDIDLRAYNRSKHFLNYHSLYINTFKRNLLLEKNQFIFENLRIRHPNAVYTVFCNKFDPNNLGISHLFWKDKAQIIDSNSTKQIVISKIRNILNFGFTGLLFYYLKAIGFALKPRTFYSIQYDNNTWYFPSLYRIKLATKAVKTTKGIPFLYSISSKNKLCVGLHVSGELLNAHPIIPKHEIHIIGDAYRPSNYPPYLFALLFKGVKYVPKYHTDRTFFSKNGIELLEPKPSFLQKDNLFKTVIATKNKSVSTVILSINHTGDWTALLSRSDTDILINSFVRISQKFVSTEFIIRLHPTMDGIKAEGVTSKTRINNFIQKLNYQNLSVSNATMEEDWARGDIFISEYSLSVIDAINKGKIGIFYNLTKRVSFVDDLLEKGINYYTEEDAIIKKIETLIST